jgi:hypothetical protein
MPLQVALIADARGYYCHVWGRYNSWDEFHNKLEDLGVEVIEDQSEDIIDVPEDEVMEDYISMDQLINHSDYMPYP